MSDQKFRNLERAYEESGSDSDKAALLRERIKIGTLTRDMVALGSYCGDLACGLIVPPDSPGMPRDWLGSDSSQWALAWFEGLIRWGRIWCLRAAQLVSFPAWSLVEQQRAGTTRRHIDQWRVRLGDDLIQTIQATKVKGKRPMLFLSTPPGDEAPEWAWISGAYEIITCDEPEAGKALADMVREVCRIQDVPTLSALDLAERTAPVLGKLAIDG